MNIKFLSTLCKVNTKGRYMNNRIAIELTNARTGSGFLTASVNIPEIDIEPNEVIIKDYSENEGIFKALVNAGIIEDTGKRVSTGFVSCPIGKLNLVGNKNTLIFAI